MGSFVSISTEAKRGCMSVEGGSTTAEVFNLLGIDFAFGSHLDSFLFQTTVLPAGESLHTTGTRFDLLCLVRSGCFKTVVFDELGG